MARTTGNTGNSTVSTRLAARILETTTHLFGVTPETLCEKAGVDHGTMSDPDARIDGADYARLWTTAVTATNDRALPIKVAMDANAMSNILQFVAKTADDLLDALSVCSRYLAILTSASSWSVRNVESVDGSTDVIVSVAHPEPDAVAIYSDEFALAEIVARGRAFSGVSWAPTEVRFAHAAPPIAADVSAFRTFFQAPLRFACAATEIVLPHTVTSLPLLKADKGMKSFFEKHLEEQLERVLPPKDGRSEILHRARQVLSTDLRGEAPTLDTLAKKLGMGSRTLRRRLADEGTSFSELLDDHRRALAKSYLENDMSIGEVAFLLGFAQASAFHRAFKRWFGSTPEQFRRDKKAS